MNLLTNRTAVIASVARSTCAVDYPELPCLLADILEARAASLTPLQKHNEERRRDIEAAIHKAADKALSQRNRRLTSPRNWTGLLHQWLRYRYSGYGLEQLPCKRVIRAALKQWTPPTGDDQTA